ncbi:MAG TPA: flagellar FliJ family protein [Pyrinomonadaceae bacterium]|nr:flagellar FliJ family protein [Pyrinomonadaceae bacterium]
MKKGGYRLQPVLDVRERAQREAARVVAARRAQLEAAAAELARREGELGACRERQAAARSKMVGETERGAEARRIVAHRTHLADLRRREAELTAAVEEQKASVARAERDLDAALAALAEASKEVQVIEKHREHWREGERRATVRREQKLSDEIAAVIHRRGQK